MTALTIHFHGLPLTLDCEWTTDPGEAPSYDCPGSDRSIEFGDIHFQGVLVDPSDEMLEALEQAAADYDGDNS